MAMLSVTEAAAAAAVSRTTIYDRLRSGALSRTPDGIDTAELARVFGALAGPEETPAAAGADVDAAHAAWLRDLVDRQADIIERQAADLAEAEARAERREATWSRQLEHLTALLPAPATEAASLPPRGLWARLVGAWSGAGGADAAA